jgi:hypothetical protein
VIGRSARIGSPTGRGVVALTVIALLAALAAGCGSGPVISSAVPVAPATGSLTPPATAERPSPGAAAQVDPGLLTFVPSAVDGVPLTFDQETSGSIAADPSVASDAASLAVALAVVPGASAADDLAIVSVVRLRDSTRDEAWFRDWRDTYDEAACGPAGGVIGNAEAELGGGTVYIGSCRGGVRTYHTRVEGAGIVVSVTALGSRRLGEKVMAGIQR